MTDDPRLCTVVGDMAAQAVVLHRTLIEVLPGASLTVLCTTPRIERALRELGLETIAARDLEERHPALREARAHRTLSEYSWTIKAPLLLDLLDRAPEEALVTYVDADVAFHSDPTPAWRQLDGASVGLAHHRFAPRLASRERWAGPFNAGWISFRHDGQGRRALAWWRERVIEWCHDRVEHGRYGDQGYLRDLSARFDGVRVFEHPGVNVAPWSDNRGLARGAAGAEIDGRPVVFFHAQSWRLRRAGPGVRPLPGADRAGYTIDGGYRPSALERELLWAPYANRVADSVRELRGVDPGLVEDLPRLGVRERVRGLARRGWMRAQELRRG